MNAAHAALAAMVLAVAGCVSGGRPHPATSSYELSKSLDLRTGSYHRRFLLHAPPAAPSSPARPLVVVLHGAFSTAQDMEKWTGWSDLADREGLVVLYPEGIGLLGYLQHWNAGHCCGRAVQEGWDDIGFINAAIDGVCTNLNIDPSRIYMVGLSNGGMLAYRFAAEHTARLAACAVVSGTIGSRAGTNEPAWTMPLPDRPLPILILHGDADASVPYQGGFPAKGKREIRFSPVSEAVTLWRIANGCGTEARREESLGGGMIQEWWTNPSGTCEVGLCRLHGWGHQWPGGPFTASLPQAHPLHGFEATPFIWEFLRGHRNDQSPATTSEKR
ncbi:MAG: PHB depolymerase family esterase [bacterium]